MTTSDIRLYAAIEGRSDYERTHTESRPTRFCEWVPGRRVYAGWRSLGFRGGFKMHVSADPRDANAVAETVLPLLRSMDIFHKIAGSPADYERLNEGNQQGKLITVYCGPGQETFLRVLAALDAALSMSGTRAGPRPSLRHGGGMEPRIGKTGHITYYTIEDYTK